MQQEIWQRFINGDNQVLHRLPEKIANSWQNCYKNQVDPYLYKPRKVMTVQELENRQKKNQELIQIVKKEMKVMQNYFEVKLPLFVLTDETGNILWRDGNYQSKDYANEIFFKEGSGWSELDVGTNAIGLVLKTKTQEWMTLNEHYSVSSRNWSCAAAPIFDEKNQLTAVLDISSYQNESSKEAQLLLGTVTQKITNTLVYHYLERKKNLLDYAIKNPEEALLCDEHFQIVHVPTKYADEFPLNEDIRKYLDNKMIYNQEEIYFNENRMGYRFLLHGFSPEQKHSYNKGITSQNENYQKFLQKVVKFANSELPIHIYGETGSGKEIIAQMIHYNSTQKNGSLVAVNCGGLNENLLESQLFGYAPGAFTGADAKGYIGKIEQADGGTLFLDEIDNMPEKMQTALLRVLEDKYVTPVNGMSKKVHFRLITASNQDLKRAVSDQHFREDLFYRIYVAQLTVPPLRERVSDIPFLIQDFCEQKNWKIHWQEEIFQVAKNYPWLGNIREFNNFLERLYIFYTREQPNKNDICELIENGRLQKVDAKEKNERQEILDTLEQEKFHVSNTAKRLGVSRATLYRKMKAYDIH
ncbi:sigma-54-dependent Fis family transcriptional regulator [Tetragenococcus halophilus]|uniref:Sigma-54-dependent Fis family transcriptional regulator n=1 Tax=Tetragenococcus halophilus TaxID=51669 RepID=A0A3G5FHH6_TETHA|nr:sigma-54-dependent Fis family transcriptional regulator [Tetragenococcus halophilus]AYW49803.1 sigma-54-dependent Fis family transcriptional regulator [Tetragenococcus halophilus]GBD64514.1 Transcriptional regulator AcoR [Tetragenococcus halophilus subsp. flandriensis]